MIANVNTSSNNTSIASATGIFYSPIPGTTLPTSTGTSLGNTENYSGLTIDKEEKTLIIGDSRLQTKILNLDPEIKEEIAREVFSMIYEKVFGSLPPDKYEEKVQEIAKKLGY